MQFTIPHEFLRTRDRSLGRSRLWIEISNRLQEPIDIYSSEAGHQNERNPSYGATGRRFVRQKCELRLTEVRVC